MHQDRTFLMYFWNLKLELLIKKVLWVIARLFPFIFVRKAYQYLTTPMVYKIRPHETEVLNRAEKETFAFNGFNIQLYRWGKGTPKVLLVNGWEGHAGNFADLVPLLLAKKFSIIAFDGPSHGASSKGTTSSFEFTDLVTALIKKFEPQHLISHSFGSVAALISTGRHPELKLEKYVGVTVPNKLRERLEEIANYLGLPYVVVTRLIEKIEANHNVEVDKINVQDYAPKSSFQRALILHDVNDRVLPVERSKEVASNWPKATFEEVQNTGHYRILRTPKVLDRIVSFLDS